MKEAESQLARVSWPRTALTARTTLESCSRAGFRFDKHSASFYPRLAVKRSYHHYHTKKQLVSLRFLASNFKWSHNQDDFKHNAHLMRRGWISNLYQHAVAIDLPTRHLFQARLFTVSRRVATQQRAGDGYVIARTKLVKPVKWRSWM